jgi:hypothetical protein
VSPQDERAQWEALLNEPGLDKLPPAALVASIRYLAGRLLELTPPTLALVTQEAPERRPEVKNMASPHLQSAFIDEARVAMGAPSKADAEACLGKYVVVEFNDQKPAMRGHLTRVIDHPANGGSSVYVMLDEDKQLMYPLNSIQSIKVVS